MASDGPRTPLLQPVAGDVVVIKVASHYHVGRWQAEGATIAAIAVINRKADALALACGHVSGRQRVILYNQAGSPNRVEFRCPNSDR